MNSKDHQSTSVEKATRTLAILSWSVFSVLIGNAALSGGDVGFPMINYPVAALGVCAVLVAIRPTRGWWSFILILALLYMLSTIGRFLYWSIVFADLEGGTIADGLMWYLEVLEYSWTGRAEKYGVVNGLRTAYIDVGHFLTQAVIVAMWMILYRNRLGTVR